ncbi:hypothetical protein [Spirobacillus cienkowskii]|uniref:hypothetical protein n=1 Tax=Spirobacillus cienkowskii TaxID=495820 RepID=UPI0030D07E0A
MNYKLLNDINPKDILAYVTQHGWKYVDDLPPSIELYKNEKYLNRQLQIPIKSELDDYPELITRLAEKLSIIEERTPEQIISDWRSTSSDTIRMRLQTKTEYQIPFTRAVQTMEAIKKALIATACSILSPQKHHAKLRRSEANELMDACKMEQTEKGSFIIKISCPIYAVNYDIASSASTKGIPFVRMTMISFMKSLKEIKELARNGEENIIIPPLLSSNFCSALRSILEDDVEFSASWALKLPQHDLGIPTSVSLTTDLIQKIECIEEKLRPTLLTQNQMIFGTIETLDGQMGDDNRRSGDVTIRFLHDDEILNAKISLNSDQYEIADKAHMTGKTITVTGLLKRGFRSNRIEKIKNFDLAEKVR